MIQEKVKKKFLSNIECMLLIVLVKNNSVTNLIRPKNVSTRETRVKSEIQKHRKRLVLGIIFTPRVYCCETQRRHRKTKPKTNKQMKNQQTVFARTSSWFLFSIQTLIKPAHRVLQANVILCGLSLSPKPLIVNSSNRIKRALLLKRRYITMV